MRTILCFPLIVGLARLLQAAPSRPPWTTYTYGPDGTTLIYNSTTYIPEQSEEEAEIEFQRSIHLSIALAGMVLLIFEQWQIQKSGYTLSLNFFHSTDCQMWIAMFLVSALWTSFIVITGYYWDDNACTKNNRDICMERLAFAPWILLITSTWWALRSLWRWLRKTFSHRRTLPARPRQGVYVPWHRLPWWPHQIPGVPINLEVLFLSMIVTGAIIPVAVGAWRRNYYTLSLLNIVALVIYPHALNHDDYHLDKPHRCKLDDIRIPLRTPYDHCLVYTLPSRRASFEAHLTRKLESEHKCLDQYWGLISPNDFPPSEVPENWSLEACKKAMRQIVLHRLRSICFEDDKGSLDHLAWWLYCPGRHPDDHKVPEMGRITSRWITPVDEGGGGGTITSRVGRDVVMALLHWEQLIYERRWAIPEDLRAKVGMLRDHRLGGDLYIPGMKREAPIGGADLNGFKQAVQHTLQVLFQISSSDVTDGWKKRSRTTVDWQEDYTPATDPLYRLADDPNGAKFKVPLNSVLSGKTVRVDKKGKVNAEGSHEEKIGDKLRIAQDKKTYVEIVWQKCWEADRSTFGALYLFLEVLYLDNVNMDEFHIAPLRPKDDNVYETEWRLRWRHTWHAAVMCQLVIMLPTLVSSFFAMASAAA